MRRGAHIAVVLTLLLTFGATRAAAGQWRLQNVPDVAGQKLGELNAVACRHASSCTGVGVYTSHTGRDRNLAANWNGTRWSVRSVPTPAHSPGFNAVSCAVDLSCMGVGGFSASWAGRLHSGAWRLEHVAPVAGPLRNLRGISCPSHRMCLAVGVSGPENENSRPYAEVWNGRHWHRVSVPEPAKAFGGELRGVSCLSPEDCFAVGDYAGTNSNGEKAFSERWNGHRLRVVRAASPHGGELVELDGVSCTSASWCQAVGSYQDQHTNTVALAEGWDGKRWKLEHVPGPGHGKNLTEFLAVSCPHRGSCEAVGDADDNSLKGYVLAERLQGGHWRGQHAADPSGFGGTLFGVSCPNSGVCEAVGWQSIFHPLGDDGPPKQFAERFS